MAKQSPVQRIWELGKDEHGRLIAAVVLAVVVLAVVGAVCGMAPYYAAARIITLLLAGTATLQSCAVWLIVALCGYLLRTALYNGALGVSHRATFSILKTIRQLQLSKLPRLPLGTVMDTASGKFKQTIVDQVDSMETTLAHLFPEMTANIAAPVLTFLYLLVLDWRLALLGLAVFPVAFVFMMMVMGGYAKDYQGAVQATNEMSSTVIEYINGIEVIKAFNQGKKSYARLVDKVRANAQYYYDWMRRSQLGMSMAYAFFPAQMLTVLPFGWLFYTHGTLTVGTFITVIILSLGMSAPIVAAFNFVDTLAQVGTTVAQVDEILQAEEQVHADAPVTFADHSMEMRDVSFSYHDGQEILHDVSLRVPQKGVTALVGPSGSGKSTLAKLLAGFWDVRSGSITMGGHDLKDIPLPQLYDQVAFVSQDNYLFDDTVLETVQGMSVVKSFNLTGRGDRKLQDALEYNRRANLAVERVMTPYTAAQEAVLQIAGAGMMLAVVLLWASGAMALASALMTVVVSFLVFSQVKLFGMGVSMLRLAAAAIDRTEQTGQMPRMDENGKAITPQNARHYI